MSDADHRDSLPVRAHAQSPEASMSTTPPTDDLRMTATESRLCDAAREFGAARLEVDRHEGEKAGPEFTAKVKAWHRTNIALQSAARAYATAERNRT